MRPYGFSILTIFPGMFRSLLEESILHRAIAGGVIEVALRDIREHAQGKHRSTDDAPFGGGSGMVMLPGPLVSAIDDVRREASPAIVALLTPAGRLFTQETARRYAASGSLALVCGRYEGVDERVCRFVDEEISIGDYVLSGGEIAAMAVLEAVTRLLPGALGNEESREEESLSGGLLEYPQYTRPRGFMGNEVPDVLLSGNHAEIRRWRRLQSLLRTRERRPDLLAAADLTADDWKLLSEHDRKESA